MITGRYHDNEAMSEMKGYTSKPLHGKSCKEYPASKWGYCPQAVCLLKQNK